MNPSPGEEPEPLVSCRAELLASHKSDETPIVADESSSRPSQLVLSFLLPPPLG